MTDHYWFDGFFEADNEFDRVLVNASYVGQTLRIRLPKDFKVENRYQFHIEKSKMATKIIELDDDVFEALANRLNLTPDCDIFWLEDTKFRFERKAKLIYEEFTKYGIVRLEERRTGLKLLINGEIVY